MENIMSKKNHPRKHFKKAPEIKKKPWEPVTAPNGELIPYSMSKENIEDYQSRCAKYITAKVNGKIDEFLRQWDKKTT